MGRDDRPSDAEHLTSHSAEPDTEREDPATPLPETESLRVPVQHESNPSRDAGVPTAASPQDVPRYPTDEPPEAPQKASFTTMPFGIGKGSNTTLQSMKRPEQVSGGVPHSRRFLHIENELDQAMASIRLLEKSVEKLKNEARFAWIVALLAAALAGAGLAL